jgi:hypothetical protein
VPAERRHETQVLREAIEGIRADLPGPVGEGWPQFLAQFDQYLTRLEEAGARTPVV